MVKARKMRLTGSSLGHNSTKPVFVNEHLTCQNNQLLGARKRKQAGQKGEEKLITLVSVP